MAKIEAKAKAVLDKFSKVLADKNNIVIVTKINEMEKKWLKKRSVMSSADGVELCRVEQHFDPNKFGRWTDINTFDFYAMGWRVYHGMHYTTMDVDTNKLTTLSTMPAEMYTLVAAMDDRANNGAPDPEHVLGMRLLKARLKSC